MTAINHPFFTLLDALSLPFDDYVIAGSAPLYVHGLRTEMHDLDVVARGKAWDQVLLHGEPEPAPYSGEKVSVVRLEGGKLEVFDHWFPDIDSGIDWPDLDGLIDTSEHFAGRRFLSLKRTMEWKRELNRPIDRDDVAAIERYVGSR